MHSREEGPDKTPGEEEAAAFVGGVYRLSEHAAELERRHSVAREGLREVDGRQHPRTQHAPHGWVELAA